MNRILNTGGSIFFTCEEEKADDHDAGVSKVEEGGGGPLYVQLRHEVVHAVDGQVERREPGRQEATPPPVIVLNHTLFKHQILILLDIWIIFLPDILSDYLVLFHKKISIHFICWALCN